MTELSDMPPELIMETLLQLPYSHVPLFCRSSRAAAELCRTPYFWKLLYQRDFSIMPLRGDYRSSYRKGVRDMARYEEGGEQALLHAAGKGYDRVVLRLLEEGVSPHAANDAALVLAAKKGHAETMRVLVGRGGARIRRDAYEKALRVAMVMGHLPVVRFLFKTPQAKSRLSAWFLVPQTIDANQLSVIKFVVGREGVGKKEDLLRWSEMAKDGEMRSYLLKKAIKRGGRG